MTDSVVIRGTASVISVVTPCSCVGVLCSTTTNRLVSNISSNSGLSIGGISPGGTAIVPAGRAPSSRRSAGGGNEAPGDMGGASSAVPHALQNRCVGSTATPHDG